MGDYLLFHLLLFKLFFTMKRHCFAIRKKWLCFHLKHLLTIGVGSLQEFSENEISGIKQIIPKSLYICFHLTFKGKTKSKAIHFQIYSFNYIPSISIHTKRHSYLFTERMEGDCIAYIRTFNIFVNHNGKKLELGLKRAFVVFS